MTKQNQKSRSAGAICCPMNIFVNIQSIVERVHSVELDGTSCFWLSRIDISPPLAEKFAARAQLAIRGDASGIAEHDLLLGMCQRVDTVTTTSWTIPHPLRFFVRNGTQLHSSGHACCAVLGRSENRRVHGHIVTFRFKQKRRDEHAKRHCPLLHATRVFHDLSCGKNFKNIFSWLAACNRPQYLLVVGSNSATLRAWFKCVRVFTSGGIVFSITMYLVTQNQMRRRADFCTPESFAIACRANTNSSDASASVLVEIHPFITSDVPSVSAFSLCFIKGDVRNDEPSPDVDVYVLLGCETSLTSASSFTELSGILREEKVTKHLVSIM